MQILLLVELVKYLCVCVESLHRTSHLHMAMGQFIPHVSLNERNSYTCLCTFFLALIQLGILVVFELLIMPFYSSCTLQCVFTRTRGSWFLFLSSYLWIMRELRRLQIFNRLWFLFLFLWSLNFWVLQLEFFH